MQKENEIIALQKQGLGYRRIAKILDRHRNIGEHFQIGFPTDAGTGIPFGIRFFFQAADILALFEMQSIAKTVAMHFHVHVFG